MNVFFTIISFFILFSSSFISASDFNYEYILGDTKIVSLEDDLLASASSASYTARRLGSALGAVLTASIVGNRLGSDFKDVYIWVWILGAGAYLLGSLITYLYYPRRNEQEFSNV